jgi:hypothetical protein
MPRAGTSEVKLQSRQRLNINFKRQIYCLFIPLAEFNAASRGNLKNCQLGIKEEDLLPSEPT